MSENLHVREIELNDIDLIADYWLNSDPGFLVNMGVDLDKLPTRKDFREMLSRQISLSIENKKSYALIWEFQGKAIGHTNVNEIEFGKHATMHLHLWKSDLRRKGIGTKLVLMSLPFYFEKLKLKTLLCEPYSLNPAPNKTLHKIGFEFIKKHKTVPGSINFKQEVNSWKLSRETYLKNKI